MNRHLNPQQFQQLDMFRPAHELKNPDITETGDFNRKDAEWGWRQKSAESDYSRGGYSGRSLREELQKNGIQTPVVITHTEDGKQLLTNGHHRTAVAHDISPNYLVPVYHHEELWPGMFKGGAL